MKKLTIFLLITSLLLLAGYQRMSAYFAVANQPLSADTITIGYNSPLFSIWFDVSDSEFAFFDDGIYSVDFGNYHFPANSGEIMAPLGTIESKVGDISSIVFAYADLDGDTLRSVLHNNINSHAFFYDEVTGELSVRIDFKNRNHPATGFYSGTVLMTINFANSEPLTYAFDFHIYVTR